MELLKLKQSNLKDFDFEYKPQIAVPVEPVLRKLNRQEKSEQKKFVNTLMYGLRAPMVFGTGGWGNDFPESQHQMRNMILLASCSKCADEEKCIMFDVMAYMWSVAFEAPLQKTWQKIYFHAFRESLPKEWKLLVEDNPDFERDAELFENEIDDMNRLRRWIFKRQMDHIKSKS